MPLIPPPNVGTINIGSRYASVYCRGEGDKVCLMGHIIYTEKPCDDDPDFPKIPRDYPGNFATGVWQGTTWVPNPTPVPSRSPPGQLCFWDGSEHGPTDLVFPTYHGFPWDWISLAINRAELEAELAVLLELLGASNAWSTETIPTIMRQVEKIRALLPFSYDEPGGQPWDVTPPYSLSDYDRLMEFAYAVLLLFGDGDGPVCPDDMVPLLASARGTGFFGDLVAAVAGDENPLGTKIECITIKDDMNPKEGTVTLTGYKGYTRARDCPPTVDVQWKLVPRVGHQIGGRGKIILRAKKKPGDPFWTNPCWVDIVSHNGSPFDIGISNLDPQLPILPKRNLATF